MFWNQIIIIIIKHSVKDYIYSLFFSSLQQVWNEIHNFLFLLCHIRQLDWRPERRAGPSRMRHERVVIIKNMFHPMDFEVGRSILMVRNTDILSFKRTQSLPHRIFLMSHPACSWVVMVGKWNQESIEGFRFSQV